MNNVEIEVAALKADVQALKAEVEALRTALATWRPPGLFVLSDEEMARRVVCQVSELDSFVEIGKIPPPFVIGPVRYWEIGKIGPWLRAGGPSRLKDRPVAAGRRPEPAEE
jgi:hypothetical protein